MQILHKKPLKKVIYSTILNIVSTYLLTNARPPNQQKHKHPQTSLLWEPKAQLNYFYCYQAKEYRRWRIAEVTAQPQNAQIEFQKKCKGKHHTTCQ